MKPNRQVNTKNLLKHAKASQHKEAYRTLDKTPNYRIGIGARLNTPDAPSFFIEILLYLCPNPTKVDLVAMEQGLIALKDLQTRSYTLTNQDDHCISCEATLDAQKLFTEYAAIKVMLEKTYQYLKA